MCRSQGCDHPYLDRLCKHSLIHVPSAADEFTGETGGRGFARAISRDCLPERERAKKVYKLVFCIVELRVSEFTG